MAKADFKMPDDFLMKVSALADRTDEIVPRVLKAGAEVVYIRVRGNLQAAIGRNTKYKSRSTGQLAAALGVSPAKLDRDGNHNVKVGFAENRRVGVSNAKIAAILEYGKHGQPPRPFMKPAKTATRAACIAAMEAKLEQEVEQI